MEVATGECVALLQFVERALEGDAAAGGTRARSEVDDVVGDGDHLGLVLDDEHGVPFVSQLQQQGVHALDVVGVQPDGGLVEDVGHVGQRGSEVTNHLGALGFSARQGTGRAVEREISQSDVDERTEGLPQCDEKRCDRRLVEAPHPRGQVADLHRAGLGNVDAADFGRPRSLVEPGASAVRAGREGDRAIDEGPDMRLHGLAVLGEEGFLNLGDQALVGHVDLADLDLDRLPVQEVVELLRRVVADRFLRVEEP